MGGVYTSKALLLDECEIKEFTGLEAANCEDLCDFATDFADDLIGSWEHPWVEFLGCSSERFDTTALLHFDYKSRWMSGNQEWSKTIKAIASDLGQLSNASIDAFLKHRDPGRISAEVIDEISAELECGDFVSAKRLITSLENLESAGLPCFRSADDLSASSCEDAFDLRERDYGEGRRVIVEMAFVWE